MKYQTGCWQGGALSDIAATAKTYQPGPDVRDFRVRPGLSPMSMVTYCYWKNSNFSRVELFRVSPPEGSTVAPFRLRLCIPPV